MTTWSSKTKATPANIRKRISAAQAAIDGALDLMKQNDSFKERDYKRLLNADAWLVDANRKAMRR